LAAKLEKTKAEEQALTADVEKYYSQAKEAAETFPGLELRMKAMDNKVFELQTVSAKIQEMAYKPFIQRVKDYLMGLACVAILLMGLNLLKSKLKMVKQARDQAKKMKEMMNGQHNYPTI
jgi:large-conductance mechanosensitive channel